MLMSKTGVRRFRLCAAATAAGFALVATPGASAAVAAPIADPATISDVVILSPEEYAAAYKKSFNRVMPADPPVDDVAEYIRTESGTVIYTDYSDQVLGNPELEELPTGDSPALAAPARDPGGTTYWHTVMWSDTDKKGVYVPTRFGDSKLGYSHYASRHNLTTSAPFRVIRNTTRAAVDQGAHKEYKAVVTQRGNLRIKMTIIMVVQAASRTDDGKYRTPDGKNVGTITAYCKDRAKCPSWVNQL